MSINKGLCGRVVKAVDSSSTIVKMHAFEPRRSHYFLLLNELHSIELKFFLQLLLPLLLNSVTRISTLRMYSFVNFVAAIYGAKSKSEPALLWEDQKC